MSGSALRTRGSARGPPGDASSGARRPGTSPAPGFRALRVRSRPSRSLLANATARRARASAKRAARATGSKGSATGRDARPRSLCSALARSSDKPQIPHRKNPIRNAFRSAQFPRSKLADASPFPRGLYTNCTAERQQSAEPGEKSLTFRAAAGLAPSIREKPLQRPATMAINSAGVGAVARRSMQPMPEGRVLRAICPEMSA